MLQTYLNIAFKYLVRLPAYSVLSILGFSIAFASIFFIYSQVSYQNSYDKHLETWDRVYRLSGEINLPDNENIHAQLGPRLGPMMKEELPAIVQMTRLVAFEEKCIVRAGDHVFSKIKSILQILLFLKYFPWNFFMALQKTPCLLKVRWLFRKHRKKVFRQRQCPWQTTPNQ